MKLLALLLCLSPFSLRAMSVTYTVSEGSTTLFQFVTGNFVPFLSQYQQTSNTGGYLSVPPGSWNTCNFPRLICARVELQINNGQTFGLVDIYDPVEESIYPIYLGSFNTDLTQTGVFPDLSSSAERLTVSQQGDVVTFAPEPSSFTLLTLSGCAALIAFRQSKKKDFPN